MQGRAKIFVEINANSSNFGNNGYIPQQSKVPKCFNHFLKNQTCCIKCIVFPCILVQGTKVYPTFFAKFLIEIFFVTDQSADIKGLCPN